VRYSITLEMPVGFHLRYKYSLGDGFWNAELNNESEFVVRDQIIETGLSVKDKVTSFSAKGTRPVNLTVQVPSGTPEQETVFVQFNPFGWMEPLPMVATGENQWQFTLYSPLHFFDSIDYRYCRNGQCDIAADISDSARKITPQDKDQAIKDTITAWENLANYTIDSTEFLSLESVQPRPGFIAGIELVPNKSTSWRFSIDDGMQYAAGIGGDWVILTPTWTAGSTALFPLIAPSPGTDLLWNEIMNQNSHVMMSGQKSILFPIINYTQEPDKYWADFPVNEGWKISWGEQYAQFIYHNADLAQILGVEGIVIGDPSIMSYWNNKQNDESGVQSIPVNWQEIISGIRARYSGRLIGTFIVNSDGLLAPDWLDQVDIIYVLFSPSLENHDGSIAEIRQEIESILLEEVEPVYRQYNKPILLGLSYASGNKDGNIDLETQAKIYSATILSAASHDWLNGFISRGYYPYVELQDTSPTIFRKPASEILWFWFHYLLNKPPQ